MGKPIRRSLSWIPSNSPLAIWWPRYDWWKIRKNNLQIIHDVLLHHPRLQWVTKNQESSRNSSLMPASLWGDCCQWWLYWRHSGSDRFSRSSETQENLSTKCWQSEGNICVNTPLQLRFYRDDRFWSHRTQIRTYHESHRADRAPRQRSDTLDSWQ